MPYKSHGGGQFESDWNLTSFRGFGKDSVIEKTCHPIPSSPGIPLRSSESARFGGVHHDARSQVLAGNWRHGASLPKGLTGPTPLWYAASRQSKRR